MNLLKTVVQTNSDTLQGTQALMLAVLQKQNINQNRNRDYNDRSEDEDEKGDLTIDLNFFVDFLVRYFFLILSSFWT